MKILILYATYSSSTQYATEIVEEELTSKNHIVTRMRVKDFTGDFSSYDLVLLASPSWYNEGEEGKPHQDFLDFMKNAEGNNFPHNMKFALLGCGDSTYAHFCGAVDHLQRFVEKMNGTLVSAPLRIDGMYFDKKTNMQNIKDWTQSLSKSLSA